MGAKFTEIDEEFVCENCGKKVEKLGIEISPKKGYVIVFKCMKCGQIRKNKVAEDDNMELVYEIARRSQYK